MLEDRVHILFVDDEDLLLRSLRRTLRATPWQLTFVNDPRQVVQIVGEQKVDVVVSDHTMPGMSGVDLLAALRLEHEPVVRMMMTGHSDRALALRAINEGHVFRFIEKPWSEGTLHLALAHAAELALRRRREEQERRSALTGRGSIRLRPLDVDVRDLGASGHVS